MNDILMKILSRKHFLFALGILLSFAAKSQSLDIKDYEGLWKGQLMVYQKGILVDSVLVEHLVKRLDDNRYTWKTDYLSPTRPVTKDYKLVLNPDEPNKFTIDEGDNLLLFQYLFDHKMHSSFVTQGILITSTYEFKGDEIIFELTSGTLLEKSHPAVENYNITSMQRMVLKRE